MSEGEALRRPRMHTSVELPPIHNHTNQEPIPQFHSPRPRELLPSIMSRSPPGRSSTLPPIQKRDKPARPRKSSITKNNRRPKHERAMSKEYARRLSIEGRKAFSAEPASAMGKRWEDLIEAATSANEADSDRDLTPVSSHISLISYCCLFTVKTYILTHALKSRSPNPHIHTNEPHFLPFPLLALTTTSSPTKPHLLLGLSRRHHHRTQISIHSPLSNPALKARTLTQPLNPRVIIFICIPPDSRSQTLPT